MRKRSEEKPKIGAGHFFAWLRQGLKELRNALYPESNVASGPAEYGLYGTRTPGEVAEGRREDGRDLEEESQPNSILGERLRHAERSRDDPGKESKDLDRE